MQKGLSTQNKSFDSADALGAYLGAFSAEPPNYCLGLKYLGGLFESSPGTNVHIQPISRVGDLNARRPRASALGAKLPGDLDEKTVEPAQLGFEPLLVRPIDDLAISVAGHPFAVTLQLGLLG